MPKVILSSDKNEQYIFCVPITSFVWQYFGFTPIVIILGKSKYTDLIKEYTKKYTNAEIFEIDSIPPYRDCTIVQFSRLFAACLEKDTNEYLLTCDIDMLTLNRYLYKDFDKMNLYGSDLTGFVHYPICYIGMTCDKWRNLLKLEYGKFQKSIINSLKEEEMATSENFVDFWFTDQRFITRKIKEFGEDKFNSVDRGHNAGIAINRIDRICKWDYDPSNDYIDFHLLKDGFEKENFDKIYHVIESKVKDNCEWIKEYVDKFNEIRNKQ